MSCDRDRRPPPVGHVLQVFAITVPILLTLFGGFLWVGGLREHVDALDRGQAAITVAIDKVLDKLGDIGNRLTRLETQQQGRDRGL